MDGAQVNILKESDKVSLSSFLEGKNSRSLESKIKSSNIFGNFANKSLEGELSD
jgi:hypothetical protein